MAYSVGGLIEASDINGFLASNADNLNAIWAIGSGDKGYGQTAVPTVLVGDIVAASNWNSLVTNVALSADHQGTAITAITAPVTNDIIAILNNLATNITLVTTSRLNAALQGATSSSSNTYNATWSNALTFTITVTFANHNSARFFFNAGGQIGLSQSHPAGVGTTINGLINDICNEAGTVWCSSPTSGSITLAGTSYNGITKVGGGYPAGTTTATNSGFYAWTAADTEISKQYADYVYGYYTADTFRSINAKYDGAGVITFTVLFDEIPNGAVVSTGTQASVTIRPPNTSYLTDTWGAPTVNITSTGS